jgi:hypothetical protein
MKQIRGTISLSSTTNITSSIRTYGTKYDRKKIIKLWQKLYATKRNSKKHYIIIEPELDKVEVNESGEMSIYNNKMEFLDQSKYQNHAYRKKLIEYWVEKYELEKYFIEIIPNYEN